MYNAPKVFERHLRLRKKEWFQHDAGEIVAVRLGADENSWLEHDEVDALWGNTAVNEVADLKGNKKPQERKFARRSFFSA